MCERPIRRPPRRSPRAYFFVRAISQEWYQQRIGPRKNRIKWSTGDGVGSILDRYGEKGGSILIIKIPARGARRLGFPHVQLDTSIQGRTLVISSATLSTTADDSKRRYKAELGSSFFLFSPHNFCGGGRAAAAHITHLSKGIISIIILLYGHTSLTRHTSIDAWEQCNHTRKTE